VGLARGGRGSPGYWYQVVKGVSAQDGRASATEFVALAGNGVGVVAQLPNVEGGEIRKKKGD